MSEIIDFPGYTKLDIEPDKALEGAIGELEKGLVIGYGLDGDLYVASSTTDLGTILLLLKRAEQLLMEQ